MQADSLWRRREPPFDLFVGPSPTPEGCTSAKKEDGDVSLPRPYRGLTLPAAGRIDHHLLKMTMSIFCSGPAFGLMHKALNTFKISYV